MFGKYLRVERARRGWTQAEAAAAFGVKQSTVSDWELNNRMPPLRRLRNVATVLGCSVLDLIEEEEEAGPK